MALLDQLLTEGVRQYQPEIKPWNESGFLTNVAQYGNIKERNAEIQRQNSIRNLIAQREKDGIPFDRLADEVAKYDLNTAMKMQNAAQNSIKFNRGESEAELANHKRTMAGWLGGEVLRRAQEAVSSGSAQWDFDYVVKVCNEAASVIFPYDPSTAEALMSFGRQGLTKKAGGDGSRQKFTKDHELEGRFLTAINTNIKQASDPNADPNNYDRNTGRYYSANRLMEWKANNPYTERNLEGRQLWSYMIDGILAYARKNRKPIGRITDDEISSLFPESAEQGSFVTSEPEVNEVPPEQKPSTETKGVKPKVVDSAKVDSSDVFMKDLTMPGRGGRIILSKDKTRQLQTAINNCVSLEEVGRIKEVLSASADLEKDNSAVFNRLYKDLDAKEKEIKEVMGDASAGATYDDLMKLKNLVGARNMNTVLVKSLRNFVNAMSGYTTTDTPYTSVTNWILVTQPDYKYINDDIQMAKTLRTNDKWTNLKSVLAMTGPFASFRELMARDIAPQVMYAMAKDGTNAMRSWWKGISKGKSPEEIENIKMMYSNMFGIDDGFWPYIEGKAHVPTPQEAEEMKKEYEEEEDSLPSITEYNKPKEETPSDSANTKYTKESWDKF